MSVHNNAIPVQILPIPKFNFTSNSTIIKDPILDNIYEYDHTGNYTITSSSCAVDSKSPYFSNYSQFVAFNDHSNDVIQSNTPINTFLFDIAASPFRTVRYLTYPKYTQFPYLFSPSGPAKYQGGGDAGNYWTTKVGGGDTATILHGEWLQVDIPAEIPMFLFKYSILVPYFEHVSFPQSFAVLGYNNGTKQWDFIDQQYLNSSPDTSSKTPVVYNLNSTKKYSSFRLVISQLFEKSSGMLAIQQWALYGTPESVINRDVDSFSTMAINQKFDSYASATSVNGVNYSNSLPLTENNQIVVQNEDNHKLSKVKMNNSVYILPATFVLATTLFIIFFKHK
jgi:hypothetical protein